MTPHNSTRCACGHELVHPMVPSNIEAGKLYCVNLACPKVGIGQSPAEEAVSVDAEKVRICTHGRENMLECLICVPSIDRERDLLTALEFARTTGDKVVLLQEYASQSVDGSGRTMASLERTMHTYRKAWEAEKDITAQLREQVATLTAIAKREKVAALNATEDAYRSRATPAEGEAVAFVPMDSEGDKWWQNTRESEAQARASLTRQKDYDGFEFVMVPLYAAPVPSGVTERVPMPTEEQAWNLYRGIRRMFPDEQEAIVRYTRVIAAALSAAEQGGKKK